MESKAFACYLPPFPANSRYILCPTPSGLKNMYCMEVGGEEKIMESLRQTGKITSKRKVLVCLILIVMVYDSYPYSIVYGSQPRTKAGSRYACIIALSALASSTSEPFALWLTSVSVPLGLRLLNSQ